MAATTSSTEIETERAAGRELQRGATIGRYVVLALVGRGGMGEVYSAYDPELDRKVAVKLLRSRADGSSPDEGSGSARLLREAQAMAKLSHPNVVVVYDVGTLRDSVFIAMEFIDGHTFGYWLLAQPRSWREVLKVFISAGRGLAAAHEAGMVHRDFKPDNVMLGRDGQVRVMDFGLARQLTDSPVVPRPIPTAADLAKYDATTLDLDATRNLAVRNGPVRPALAPASAAAAAPGGAAEHDPLTETGALLGTPAYMAPEQFAGGLGDARTDQFSFCVALHEALYGSRPFAGNTFVDLGTSVTQGKLVEPTGSVRVPSRLRKILLRGLSRAPEDRFPSMTALLTALENDPAVSHRRALVVAAAVILFLAVVVNGQRLRRDERAVCAEGSEKLGAIWEAEGSTLAPRRAAIRAAFLGSGKSYAENAYRKLGEVLDGYARRWTIMYTDACRATHVRGEQSAEVLDLRMGCLQERLESVRALTDVFATADSVVVESAMDAANALPNLSRCADVPLLRAVIKPPEGAQAVAQVAALKQEVARVKALADSGHCRLAADIAEPVISRARQLRYAPLLAEALETAAILGDDCGDAGQGIDRHMEAYWTAQASHHDQIAAQAAVLVFPVLGGASRFEEARQWRRNAEATLQRIGGDPVLESWLANGDGLVLGAEGRHSEALATIMRALAMKEKLFGKTHLDVGRSLANLALELHSLGRHDEAIDYARRAVALFSDNLGPDHPLVALGLSNEGEILDATGRHREAREFFASALALWKRAGSDQLYWSFPLTGIGRSHLAEGHPAAALPLLEEAYRIRLAKERDPVRLGEIRFALARALWEKGSDRPRARALAAQAKLDYASTRAAGAQLAEIERWLAERSHGN